MKFLLDFLPIVLFFATFKYTQGNPEQASAWATQAMGFLTAGGVIPPDQAPILLATAVVIAATVCQVLILFALGKRIEPMVWISLALVVVMGGATIWFHSDTFIKWKPSLLYWAMSIALAAGQLIWKKNGIRKLTGANMQLPDAIWQKLLWAWVTFFMIMGLINLAVAYQFSTDIWVNFKLFGSMGLMLAFVVGQGIFLSRHIINET